MNNVDAAVFGGILLFISGTGIFLGRRTASKTSADALIGSNVSTLSIALSVCSSFLSAVSLLGFPAEIYYRGASPIWYLLVYFISFPIVAKVFLPVFYNLRLGSVYEYLEKRFCFASRLIASFTFILQTILYLAVALYAPSLALAQCLHLPIYLSIFLTASISAIYLYAGGARAGIYTSALQMGIITLSLLIICITSVVYWNFGELWNRASMGGRLNVVDLRPNPQIRHSVWAFVLGGTGNMFSLFAVNQLTMQRYIAMPSLRSAQWVVFLNIPMNALMLLMYSFLGVIIYAVNANCHPTVASPDQIFPQFIESQLNWMIGLEGLFMASVYSAGVSTLTASYNALTAVFIEDVIKAILTRRNESIVLNAHTHLWLIKALPFFFAFLAMILATLVDHLDTMILQIAFSIFGAGGGIVLAIFVVGMFCPLVSSNAAALAGQVAAIVVCGAASIGALVYNVKPVNLPLNGECLANSTMTPIVWDPSFGTVTAAQADGILIELSKISYQYYSVVAILAAVVISHLTQFVLQICKVVEKKEINYALLAGIFRAKPPNIVIEAAESQALSKNQSENFE